MKHLILVVLAISLLGGNCMPIIAGTAALQAVPALLVPVASSLGQGIGLVIQNLFDPLVNMGDDGS